MQSNSALTLYLPFLLLHHIVFSINLSPQPSIHNPYLSPLPSSPSNSSLPIAASTNPPSPNNHLTNTMLDSHPNCLADHGRDLNKASCQQALQLMSTDPIHHTYGPRDLGVFDVVVPRRYLSRKSSSSHSSKAFSRSHSFFFLFSFSFSLDRGNERERG